MPRSPLTLLAFLAIPRIAEFPAIKPKSASPNEKSFG
jgi:hypothetical protein